MAEITLPVESGRSTGSRSSGRLRADGKIPGVVYGHGIQPLPVAVDARALRAALSTDAGTNALLNLTLDGSSHLTLAREIQRHPVRHTVLHVDFQIVGRDEVIAADVPVNLVGESEQVHRGDGVIDHQLFSLHVKATPANVPNAIEVDISGMAIGDTIRVGDLRLPAGVETEVDPDQPVVIAQPPQVSEADLLTDEQIEAQATAEAEAAEAGEAAEVEGEAPAAEAEGESGAGGEG